MLGILAPLSARARKSGSRRDNYRKKRTEHEPILIDGVVVEQVGRPWCPHHQQTNMVQAHQDSCEEGTTKPIPPPGPLSQALSEEDSSHPSHRLFSLLLHGKRYRSAKSRSKRLLNSINPQSIRLS